MSRIALSGNPSGSGTLTIASPNTNSDATFNLPTTGGDLLVNGASQAATFSALTVNGNNISAQNSLGFRNRIINGDMRIDQRNAGAAVAQTAAAVYTLDRFFMFGSVTSKFSVQQNAGSVTPPTGFTNYLGVTSLSAYTPAIGTEQYVISQIIEGYNIADLGWGTANASPITLSFWVRSSLTGTFGGALRNSNNSRSYPFTYTISSANTWEQKSVTITGDTSGTWLTDNNAGIKLTFGLGAGTTISGTAGSWAGTSYVTATGATSVVATNGATFYITGVQLEAGSVATPFERRPYGTELALCQRYYYKIQATGTSCLFGNSLNASTVEARGMVFSKVQMRTAPTALEQSGTATDYRVQHLSVNTNCSAVPQFANAEVDTFGVNFTVASGLTAGQASLLRSNSANAFLAWSAEL
jgi:hypothetical protein